MQAFVDFAISAFAELWESGILMQFGLAEFDGTSEVSLGLGVQTHLLAFTEYLVLVFQCFIDLIMQTFSVIRLYVIHVFTVHVEEIQIFIVLVCVNHFFVFDILFLESTEVLLLSGYVFLTCVSSPFHRKSYSFLVKDLIKYL